MSVDVVGGYPQYADSAIRYIPQLFASATLVKYYAKSTVAAVANTKYEGVIKGQGDKVYIRTRPSITVRKYKKGQELESEAPSSAPIELNIDQAQYYDFIVDDVDEAQADIVLASEFTDDSGEQMRIQVDTDVLGTVYVDAHAKNQGTAAGAKSGNINLGAAGAPLSATKQNALEIVLLVGLVLNEQNVPESDRWDIFPAWFRFLLLNSDMKNACVMGDGPSRVLNGRIGQIDQTDLYMSNLLTVTPADNATATHCLCGHKDALTFAAQLSKNENLRAAKKFGTEYRGLYVYGRKVVKPEGLVHLYIYKG